MPRLFLRFIALLLISCLVADPATVGATQFIVTAPMQARSTAGNAVFVEQAITSFLVQGWTKIGHLKFRRSIDLRRQEKITRPTQPTDQSSLAVGVLLSDGTAWQSNKGKGKQTANSKVPDTEPVLVHAREELDQIPQLAPIGTALNETFRPEPAVESDGHFEGSFYHLLMLASSTARDIDWTVRQLVSFLKSQLLSLNIHDRETTPLPELAAEESRPQRLQKLKDAIYTFIYRKDLNKSYTLQEVKKLVHRMSGSTPNLHVRLDDDIPNFEIAEFLKAESSHFHLELGLQIVRSLTQTYRMFAIGSDNEDSVGFLRLPIGWKEDLVSA